MSSAKFAIETELHKLQEQTFQFLLHETNPPNGLVIDKTAARYGFETT